MRAALLAAAALVPLLVTAPAWCLDLITQGKPAAKIYLAAPLLDDKALADKNVDPSAQALTLAVQDLNYHLRQMSGAELEIVVVDAPAKVAGPAVVIGALATKLGAAPTKLCESQEGYRLLTKDQMLLIGGQSDAAAALGVYELLARLGCDWVMPGTIGEIIPRQATVSVGALDVAETPDFLMRSLWYRGYNQPRLPEEGQRMSQWLRRQKGGNWRSPVADAGGHVWDAFIKRHKAEFDKDPTMYALRRGPDGNLQRMGPQLEPTHPRVIELFIQDIKDTYQKNIAAGKWTKDSVAGFGIGPADGLGYSISAEALASGSGRIDPIVGEVDRTDELVLLANRILEEVHKEYPNAHVGFYSYSTHADFPMRYQPNPKLVVIFAPINFSRFHSTLDDYSKTQPFYRGVVEQWGRLHRQQGNPLIYRGYNWNLAENMLPYSRVHIWGEELPFYQQQGVMGLRVEATKAWAVNGPSDYVFMKMAWNTGQKWEDLLEQYCRRSFGPAAAAMQRYLLTIIKTQREAGQEAGSYHAFPLVYEPAIVAAMHADIEQALAAAGSEAERTRVSYFAQGLKTLDLYLAFRQAMVAADFPGMKAGYDAMIAHWKSCYDQNTDTVANEAPAYLKRFLSRFVDEGVKFSSEPYRVLYHIPDELPTLFDPHAVGQQMHFQSPQISDRRLLKTKTFSSTWDAQGLSALRSGAVWYRVHFTLPADAKDKPIGLFVGSVDDEARVWINGQMVGTSGRGFSAPALFDLTEGIRYQGDNVLAIQVVRNSLANEIGTGGILRPCYVFTGPRLEHKSPKPLELRRVLPGGELGEIEK